MSPEDLATSPEATAVLDEPPHELRGENREPRRSPRLAANRGKSRSRSTLQKLAWFAMATFGGMTMAQGHQQDTVAFLSHDVRTPIHENILTPNDTDIEVKTMKTSAFSKKELQHLAYVQHMDSFEDAVNPSECPIAITGHQLRRFDPDDIHYCFNVQWLNGDNTSVRADALGLHHPDLVADYTTKRKLTSKPAFEWVPDCPESQLGVKAKIVSMSARAAKNIKFGMAVANNIKHALMSD